MIMDQDYVFKDPQGNKFRENIINDIINYSKLCKGNHEKMITHIKKYEIPYDKIKTVEHQSNEWDKAE